MALAAFLSACAHRGYFLDESTRRIYTRDALGRVTKVYEPDTPEHTRIAGRFWPELLDGPEKPEADPPGRRGRMAAFMKGLDKDQWHILLDMDLWTGDDRADLARLEDLQQLADAVKGLGFGDYLGLKDRFPVRSELRAQLLKGAGSR